jgi:hypothetical protein
MRRPVWGSKHASNAREISLPRSRSARMQLLPDKFPFPASESMQFSDVRQGTEELVANCWLQTPSLGAMATPLIGHDYALIDSVDLDVYRGVL